MKRAALLLMLLLAIPSLACVTSAMMRAPVSAPSPIAPLSPTSTPQPVCIVSAESLNIRTQPEGQKESRVLGWLYSGDVVTVLETRGAWMHVKARGFTGWINSRYCRGK